MVCRNNFTVACNICECLLSCFQQVKEVLVLFLGECIIAIDSVNYVRHINRGNVRLLKITPPAPPPPPPPASSPHFSLSAINLYGISKLQPTRCSVSLFIFTDALHVSGGSSAHHQEHITVHTASGIVSQYCC